MRRNAKKFYWVRVAGKGWAIAEDINILLKTPNTVGLIHTVYAMSKDVADRKVAETIQRVG